MKRKLTKTDAKIEKEIYKLVSKRGVSKAVCIRQFQLPANYFSRYQGAHAHYDKAMAVFTSDVLMKSVVETLSMDSAGRKYLMTKLRVFDKEIELPIKTMTTAKHASQNLSFALSAYARKELTDDSLQAIRQACDVFSGLMTATVLEEKISDLEKMMKEKFNDQNS